MNDMSDLNTYIRRFLYVCAVLAALCGCHKGLQPQDDSVASLRLVLNVPAYEPELKSVSSDPLSPDSWTQWERAVDGRYIYRVTAFILQGDRLVAHEDLELDGEATRTEIDFEGNFTHGSYTLLVAANYSGHEADDGPSGIRRYDGIQDFTETVEDILNHGLIDNFTDLYSGNFMNYMIRSEDGVCPRVPQPLTLVRNIELQPGINEISGELIRTYSRVRIAVENNSDEELNISTISFSDAFTRSSAYIFPGKGCMNERQPIDVTSPEALTPFTGTETSPLIIPAKGTSVIFDAYILESQSNTPDDNYSCNLGLSYENQVSYTLKSNTAVTKTAGLISGHYLIYSRSNRYLKAGDNSVESPENTLGTLQNGMSIPKEYVWTLDNRKPDGTALGKNQFYIGTAEAMNTGQTSYYMASLSSTSVTLGSNKSIYFNVGERANYLTFESSAGGTFRYLGINYGNVVGYYSNGSSAQFALYPVDAPSGMSADIPLNTINNSTGQAEEVTDIARNDFINAIVKVSYSKNHGHFIYEVMDWGEGGGDVSFN